MNNDKWLKGVIYSNNLSKKDIEIKELKKENRFQMKLIEKMNKNNDKLQARINEAIEYIENNDLYYQDVDYDYEENMILDPPSDEEARAILLSILRGDSNE